MKSVVKRGTAYANPTSKWPCAPLLVSELGAVYRFTSDLKPVDVITMTHQFPTLNIEYELDSLRESEFFPNVNMAHSYWKLMLAPE